MKVNSILINNKDNVVTSLEKLVKDSNVSYKKDNSIESVKAISDVPSYHKVAIKDILVGDYIYKYGEVIGVATNDINVGYHVSHLNIDSVPRDYTKEVNRLKGE